MQIAEHANMQKAARGAGGGKYEYIARAIFMDEYEEFYAS
jgi:hypothetical protein